MKEKDKRQLEGLLQARSEDMRHGRRPRARQPTPGVVFERPVPATERSYATSPARLCEECGGEIGIHRLRAMPRATLCLDCQRSTELAGTPS